MIYQPDYRMFTIERSAHADNEFGRAIEKLLPMVVWVEYPAPPVPNEHFPCGALVYTVHQESVSQLYRQAGLSVPTTPRAVCECMGKIHESR